MNVIFLGEREIAKRCLSQLAICHKNNSLNLSAVVTNQKFYSGMIKAHLEVGLTQFISNDSRNVDAVITLNIDTLISVQHKWILPQKILDAVNGNAFNLHNAKLPQI